MNKRTRILLIAVGSLVLLLLLGLGAKMVFTKPLKEIEKRTAGLREKLGKIKGEQRLYFQEDDLMKNQAQRMFADDVDRASAKSGELLTKQILQSGLREADFSRIPVGVRKLRGAIELGWSVQGEGKLQNILDLLFLAQQSPYLHRVESLNLSPSETTGLVRVRFRFLTLVIDPAPVVDLAELQPKVMLDSPERRAFDLIAARDILRPHVKPSETAVSATRPQPSTSADPESLRVVSLSDWMGQPEIHLLDLEKKKTTRHRPGEALAGGTIVMVDYRAMPMPGHEGLQSFSRVILKIGADYWAVERGRTLAEKYKLTADKLPEKLVQLSN
jgi:hypothetical protein